MWLRYNYLEIWNLRVQKNSKYKIFSFKVQIKSLTMHFTDQKGSCAIFTVCVEKFLCP